MTIFDANRSARSYLSKPKLFIVTRGARLARVVVVVACAVAVSVLVADRVVGGVHDAELRACHRLNIMRATENRNWLLGYVVLTSHGLRGARDLEWVPLTVCHNAVFHNYRAPTPVRFARQLPPRSALHLGPQN